MNCTRGRCVQQRWSFRRDRSSPAMVETHSVMWPCRDQRDQIKTVLWSCRTLFIFRGSEKWKCWQKAIGPTEWGHFHTWNTHAHVPAAQSGTWMCSSTLMCTGNVYGCNVNIRKSLETFTPKCGAEHYFFRAEPYQKVLPDCWPRTLIRLSLRQRILESNMTAFITSSSKV